VNNSIEEDFMEELTIGDSVTIVVDRVMGTVGF